MGTLWVPRLRSTRLMLRSVLVSGMLQLLQVTVGKLVRSHVPLGDHRRRVVRQLLVVVGACRTGHGRVPALLQTLHRRQTVVARILLLSTVVYSRPNGDLLGDSRRWRCYGGTLNAGTGRDRVRGGNVVIARG